MRSFNKHSINNYERLVKKKIKLNGTNRDLALAQSVGSPTMEIFEQQGDGHVAVLKHHSLIDGMRIYDLGCGCGRTAQALQRSGWVGRYQGADIVKTLVKHVQATCPGYEAFVHQELSIKAEDEAIDMIFHWSVFTHLFPEECFIYLRDIHRALKPGGTLVFSFLEVEDPAHRTVFDARVEALAANARIQHFDNFLHRDWIQNWADRIGFQDVRFTSGADSEHHSPFWQSLVAMNKPAAQ